MNSHNNNYYAFNIIDIADDNYNRRNKINKIIIAMRIIIINFGKKTV